MGKRLLVQRDGNAIGVGLGDMPEGKFHFRDIEKDSPGKRASSIHAQSAKAVEEWFAHYPEEGRLPFDIDMDSFTTGASK